MLVLASIAGFMGPFGTYADAGLIDRIVHWWRLLMGAYLLVRPSIIGLEALARATDLPKTATAFWGVIVVSVPLGIIWRNIGEDTFRELDGYTGLLPFSLLCSLGVLGVSRWGSNADRRLARRTARPAISPNPVVVVEGNEGPTELPTAPVLRARLAPAFRGPILALQSEDHYVRVHGEDESELLLIRLRDAIAEMGGISGEQVHRSWWVSHAAIARAEVSGRSWNIVLTNGVIVPVARDSVPRLQAVGVLPGAAPGPEDLKGDVAP